MLIDVYSPLAANQPAAYAGPQGHRKKTWNIVQNSSELQEIPYADVSSVGSRFPGRLRCVDQRLMSKFFRVWE